MHQFGLVVEKDAGVECSKAAEYGCWGEDLHELGESGVADGDAVVGAVGLLRVGYGHGEAGESFDGE